MLKYSLKTTYGFWLFFSAVFMGVAQAVMSGEFAYENIIQLLCQSLYVEPGTDDASVIILMNLLPTFLLCIVTSNFFCNDINIIYTYVFPRAGSTVKLYSFKTLSLFLQTLEFYTIFFLTVFILRSGKENVFSFESFGLVVQTVLPYILFGFCSAFFVNVFALIFSGKISFLIYVCLASLLTFICVQVKSTFLTAVNPIYHLILTFHNLPQRFYGYIDSPGFAQVSFKNVYSYVFFAIFSFVLYVTGAFVFNNKSLLLRKEKQP